MTATQVELQQQTDAYFDSAAGYWDAVYDQEGVAGAVYRRRMHAVLDWIDDLGLPAGTTVLEVGCGSGLLSTALHGRGFEVHSTDSAPEMVDRTRRRLDGEGFGGDVFVADAHDLAMAGGAYDLVVAVGVLPWLHAPSLALAELARVLTPGGRVVLTADNRRRLNRFVEPRGSLLMAPARRGRRILDALRGHTHDSAPSFRHRAETVKGMLREAGLEPERSRTLGFGPFTFWGRPVLSEAAGLRIDAWMERRAARGSRVLAGTGWHCLVQARRAR
jgi:2-polyprenyl-3-methyl-5-hydroxy-6-metoxy-1,4-benzoquinol methylase